MAYALIILILCPVVVVYYVIRYLSIIKQYENEKATLDHFLVHIKYKHAALRGFVVTLYSLVLSGLLLYLLLLLGDESIAMLFALALVPIVYLFLGAVFLIPVRNVMMIKENQITRTTLLGTKKTFMFGFIKKARFYRGRRGALLLRLTDFHDKEICVVNFKYNNINLLIERLKSANVIGISKTAYETPMPKKISKKIQYPENNTFVIKSGKSSLSFASCLVVFCISVPVSAVIFIIVYLHDPGLRELPNVAFIILIFALFIPVALNALLFRITYANGVFEYRDFIGLKRKFEMKDISYVEFFPQANIFDEIHIFLKTGKRICSINSSDDNFDLLLDTLKSANIEFR